MIKSALLIAALAVVPGVALASTVAVDGALKAKGAFTVAQVEDADVVDSQGREAGDVEHVLLDPAGKPTAVVLELDRPGADKLVSVALVDIEISREPGDDDDYIARSKLTKAQLLALPDWKR